MITRFILSLLAFCLVAWPQDEKRFAPVFGGRRLALVIGNKSYSWKPLVNPANDATAVAKMLTGLGFAPSDVHLVIDANQTELRHSVRQFVESVKAGDLAFVYYSGHGIEVKGSNYLLPTDLPSDATEGYVEDEAVSAQRLLNELSDQGAAVKVLILDACRDNPLRATKSTAGGLVQMEGSGALILFATQAGKTAADTPGSANSVFAKYLLKGLSEPGVPLREAAYNVARNVARETNNKQIPQMYGMMLEDVVLVPGSATAAPPRVSMSAPAPADQEAWLAVKDSGSASLLQQFITAFPQSSYAEVARIKLASITPQTSAEQHAKSSPALPPLMHFCGQGCFALTLVNGHYVSGSAVWTVASFTRDLVILNRDDGNGFRGFYKGQIASDGNSLINICSGDPGRACRPSPTLWITWGSALDSIPGSGMRPRGLGNRPQ